MDAQGGCSREKQVDYGCKWSGRNAMQDVLQSCNRGLNRAVEFTVEMRVEMVRV